MLDQVTIIKIAPIDEGQRESKYSPNFFVLFSYKNERLFIRPYITDELKKDKKAFNEIITSMCNRVAKRIYQKGI